MRRWVEFLEAYGSLHNTPVISLHLYNHDTVIEIEYFVVNDMLENKFKPIAMGKGRVCAAWEKLQDALKIYNTAITYI